MMAHFSRTLAADAPSPFDAAVSHRIDPRVFSQQYNSSRDVSVNNAIGHLLSIIRREQALRAQLWADLSSMRTDPWLWGCSVRVQRLATMRRIRESFHREQVEIDARRDLIELHYNNKETPSCP